MAANAKPNAEIEAVSGKDLVNKDGKVTKLIEWATQSAASPEEIMDMFLEEGVPFSHGEELTGDYKVVTKEMKEEWCDKHIGTHLFCVTWDFYDGVGDQEFAAVHIISAFGKFIMNDGAKGGMYGQLRKTTDFREEQDPESAVLRTSTAGFDAPKGLRRNKPFQYDTRPKSDKAGEEHFGHAIPRRELDDTVKWPNAFRETSRPTWSFDI